MVLDNQTSLQLHHAITAVLIGFQICGLHKWQFPWLIWVFYTHTPRKKVSTTLNIKYMIIVIYTWWVLEDPQDRLWVQHNQGWPIWYSHLMTWQAWQGLEFFMRYEGNTLSFNALPWKWPSLNLILSSKVAVLLLKSRSSKNELAEQMGDTYTFSQRHFTFRISTMRWISFTRCSCEILHFDLR